MRVLVISPEQSVFDGEADQIVAPAFDGEVGILPRHAPFMTLLGDGILTVRQGAAAHRFTVRGGFLQVLSDVIRVVAGSAQNA
jgi:F-type H+-transporting ATPase subunit epsilon